MSAAVCGKRSLFDDFGSPPLSKRVRCGSGSPSRFSHLASETRPDNRSGSSGGSSSPLPQLQPEILVALRQLFPGMADSVLQSSLDACGNNIDSAIRSLNELRLSQTDRVTGTVPSQEASVSAAPVADFDPRASSTPGYSSADVAPVHSQAGNTGGQLAGADWVDLVVREMLSAVDMDDARARAARVLEGFEKAVQQQGVEKAALTLDVLRKENGVLKDHLIALLKDNHILKRAVTIQHERQVEHEGRKGEVEELKGLMRRYEEQMRTLEMNNYALNVHLRQAQERTSMPSRFNPDIF